MTDSPTISLCKALRHEAESVMEYEEIIAEIGNSEAERGVKQQLAAMQMGSMENIQTLTISLSKMFAGPDSGMNKPEPGMNKPEDTGSTGEVEKNG